VPELQANQPPPADYYAANLRRLVDFVVTNYGDLLSDSARLFASRFTCASTDSQRLFARLISRKGPWIRQDKLNYAEVGNLQAALGELQLLGLTQNNGSAPADFLLQMLTAAERRLLFPTLPAARRDDWICACVGRYPDGLIRSRVQARHPWVSIAAARDLALCQLLYFGDGHQDTSAFVLEDLGVMRYPEYALTRAERLFADPGSVNRYRRLRYLRYLSHRLAEAEGLDHFVSEALWQSPVGRHEQRLHDGILNHLGRHFERQGDFDTALSCYSRSSAHPARERRVRILRKLGDTTGADQLITQMRTAPLGAEEEDFAQRAACTRRSSPAADTTTLCLNGAAPERIEHHAGKLLSAAGGEAWHVENQLPLMLAGLCYWDVIYASVPGAFVNPYQLAPLDLFWSDFAASRHDLLEERNAELDSPGAFTRRMLDHHQRYNGLANRLVSWQFWSAQRLQLLLEHVPERHLRAIARYVIKQPYRARRGFPDLLVIYGSGSYEFVEVKGPTDALQPAQRIWLQNLDAMGIPARVLKFKA
jgi:hypothetical protein